jgi:N-acetylneuraminic acid mutarotase
LIPEPQTNITEAGVISLQAQNYHTNGLGNQAVNGTPQIKNHTATLYNKKLYVFGGYDGKKNHSSLRVFDTEKNMWGK